MNEEYLSELKPWSRAVKVYQEMQDDIVIGSLFEAIKTPLLASPFEVIAASDDEADMMAKAFVEENLFKMPDLEWTSHVEEMLEFMDMGFAISEKVVEKGTDGMMYLTALIPIGQESLETWGDIDEFGRVKSFNQRDKNGKILSAPMDKLLHFTFRGRKRNPQGRGILRSLYRPWFFKKNLETIEAIGAERDVGNAPVVTLKEGVKYTQTDLDNLASALEGFRMDEAVYVILPGGATLEAYGGGNKVYNVREMIRDWQHLIRQRFFADFISLGSEAVGTQALADEMTTFFGLALRSIQEKMLSVWNRQLIPWIFEVNNLHPAEYPRLEWLRPHDMNLQSLAQAYNTLIGANMLDPNDTELRNRVRTQLGLKPLEGPLQVGPETDEGLAEEAIPEEEVMEASEDLASSIFAEDDIPHYLVPNLVTEVRNEVNNLIHELQNPDHRDPTAWIAVSKTAALNTIDGYLNMGGLRNSLEPKLRDLVEFLQAAKSVILRYEEQSDYQFQPYKRIWAGNPGRGGGATGLGPVDDELRRRFEMILDDTNDTPEIILRKVKAFWDMLMRREVGINKADTELLRIVEQVRDNLQRRINLEEDCDEVLEAFEEDDGTYTISEFAQPVAQVSGVSKTMSRSQSVSMNPDRGTQSSTGRSIPDNEKFVAVYRDEKGRGVAVFVRAKDQSIAMAAAKKIEAGISSRLPGGKLAKLLGQGNQELWVSPEEMAAKAEQQKPREGRQEPEDKEPTTKTPSATTTKTDDKWSRGQVTKRAGIGAAMGLGIHAGVSLLQGRLRGFTALKDAFEENTQKFGLLDFIKGTPKSARGTQITRENIHYAPEGAARHPDVKKLKARIDGLMQQYRTRIIDADRTLDALIKARTKARRTSGGYRGGPNVRILLLSMVDDAIAEVTASSNLSELQYRELNPEAILDIASGMLNPNDPLPQGEKMRLLSELLLLAHRNGFDQILGQLEEIRDRIALMSEQQFQGGPKDLEYDILHKAMKQATWLLGRVPEWEDMQDLYALGKLKLTDIDWEMLNLLKRNNIFEEDAEYHFQGDPEDLIQEAEDTVDIIQMLLRTYESTKRQVESGTALRPETITDQRFKGHTILDAIGLLKNMVSFATKQGWSSTAMQIEGMIKGQMRDVEARKDAGYSPL